MNARKRAETAKQCRLNAERVGQLYSTGSATTEELHMARSASREADKAVSRGAWRKPERDLW